MRQASGDGDHRAALGEDLGQQGTVAGQNARHLRWIVVALESLIDGRSASKWLNHQERAERCQECERQTRQKRDLERAPNARTDTATS